MAENSVVGEALDDSNYDVWSNCMETYLVGQDLWDIIEPEGEETSENNESPKTRRRKNALALHALHISCGAARRSTIGKSKSAKEAWDLLRSMNQQQSHSYDRQISAPYDSSDDEEVTVVPSIRFDKDGLDYGPFLEAVKDKNWKGMKKFLNSHPEANATVVVGGRTPLHYATFEGMLKIASLLLDRTKRHQDLEILDDQGYTAFDNLTVCNKPGAFKLLKRMVSMNKNLPNIYTKGDGCLLPVIMASVFGLKDRILFLYNATDEDILNPEISRVAVELLTTCINCNIFDIATKIVDKNPLVLQQQDSVAESPFNALIGSFGNSVNNIDESGNTKSREQVTDKNKLGFLRLVCEKVRSHFDPPMLKEFLYPLMVKASRLGAFEFVKEMIRANPGLLNAHVDDKGIFCHAAECRQEKVFSLIYSFPDKTKLLYWVDPAHSSPSTLHLLADSARSLDWKSSPVLEMQREFQWFQEVYLMTEPVFRDLQNKAGLTPRQLFTETHKQLADAGEKSMKEIAQSSTVVGSLIITMMFAAAFTVPGGSTDNGLPLFMSKALFKIFIVCDAISLYSAITSVLVFLGILTSRYSEVDFLMKLPRKLMIGLYTLFFSVSTMMLGFCAVLSLTLDGLLRFFLPIMLMLLVPIILYYSSIFPLFYDIFMSTFGPSIFDKRKVEYPWMKSSSFEDIDEQDTESLTENLSNIEKV